VSDRAAGGAVRAVVLDVEGTTTPVTFVYDVLFPYARARLESFARAHREDPSFARTVDALAAEWAGDSQRAEPVPSWPEAARRARAPAASAPSDSEIEALCSYLSWLMDRDRKSTALKTVQGEIWRGGFERGELRGEVYPDVRPALERWRRDGRTIAIYSSGSVLAQRQLFGHSTAGDLTPLIDRHFDTTVGAKRDTASYVAIARALELAPEKILFVSDVDAELAAARVAGFATRLCVRGGDALPSDSPVVRTFDDL